MNNTVNKSYNFSEWAYNIINDKLLSVYFVKDTIKHLLLHLNDSLDSLLNHLLISTVKRATVSNENRTISKIKHQDFKELTAPR
jgi:hypothetical protein